jgi:Fibronectin type III domain/Putative Ig domain
MYSIRPLESLPRLSALLVAASLLTGCGDGVGVSPAAATVASAPGVTSVKLTGTPATSITAGKSYIFQPTVAQGGGVVTFQIQGKPTWAAFDVDTGVLTGTPATTNEGRTASITITGTNGSSSSSIGPFTILVNAPPPAAPATGSALLTWIAPTENTDGSPITGLAGYHIYYGTSASELTSTVTVTGPAETSYIVGGLAPGTYYFAVVAYNTAGIDSADSNVASKTI